MTEHPEFEVGQATYSVRLPSFEGPLDLLLHLCQKHELEIMDIPVAFVTEKYLEYLDVMQVMSLDIASEYLVMAATLVHIKSKMLLPVVPTEQDQDEEDEEDPRERLIRQLLEYQKYKKAAEDLMSGGIAGADVFSRGGKIETVVHEADAPLAEVPLFSLVEAFHRVLGRTKVPITHDIVADRVSINDRIHELIEVLKDQRQMPFEQLFEGVKTKFDVVITFLALLEMGKLRLTRLFQTDPLAPIYVELSAQHAQAQLPDTEM